MVTFTEEILNGKLHFLCSVGKVKTRFFTFKISLKTPLTVSSKLVLPSFKIKHLSLFKDVPAFCISQLRVQSKDQVSPLPLREIP